MFIFSRNTRTDVDADLIRRLRNRLLIYFSVLICAVVLLSTVTSVTVVNSVLSNQSVVAVADKLPALTCICLFQFCLVIGVVSFLLRKGLQPLVSYLESIRQFTQDAGHELATPVSVARSRLQILERSLEENCSAADAASDLKVVQEAVKRMSGLVEDVRMLARTQNPEKYLQLSLIRLDLLIANVVKEMTLEFQHNGTSVKLQDLCGVSIIGDKEALERVLINLLTNAVRYGKNGGLVVIELQQTELEVQLAVSDDGPGIPNECVPKLFSRFYRASTRSVGKEKSGTGLGLAIVKAIVEAHNGSIELHTEEGKGTCFKIRLPKFPVKHQFALFAKRELRT